MIHLAIHLDQVARTTSALQHDRLTFLELRFLYAVHRDRLGYSRLFDRLYRGNRDRIPDHLRYGRSGGSGLAHADRR
ncbi:MAG: hypothetical protein IPG69_15755 [Flavobacteriales bacterium]|nr:hypothetical protein [Flavobacteriales bacterium]